MAPRSGTSSVRQHGSPGTRAAVLDAAQRLFAERGYHTTTITEIARHAGVGTNTVYVGFGNKPGIVSALIERVTTDPGGTEAMERVRHAENGEQVLDALAEGARATHERYHSVVTLMFDTARVDPAIAETQRVSVAGYRGRLEEGAARISELGELRRDLSVPEATDLLWFYLGLSPWRVLVDMSWTWNQAQRFLVSEAKRAVLATTAY